MSTNATLEENDTLDSMEDRYTYVYDVPSLQEIVSHQVAREVWYNNVEKYQAIKEGGINVSSNCYYVLEFCCDRGNQQYILHLIEKLNIPTCIKEMLKCSIRDVNLKIKLWIGEILHSVFYRGCLKDRGEVHHVDPKWCVWSFNGEIDREKSARKILNVGGLAEVLKFIIMCEYCMEDEIKKFSLELLPPEFMTEDNYSRDGVCFYWIRYLKKEQHKILFDRLLAGTILQSNKFFWCCLGETDQVRFVSSAVSQQGLTSSAAFKCDILEQFISTMSENQQQRLLSEFPHLFVIFFALHSNSSRCALWAWRHSKDGMSVEQFTKIVGELLSRCETSVSKYSLIEIWNTASDYHRNHVIRAMSDISSDQFLSYPQFSNKRVQRMLFDERRRLVFRNNNLDVIHWCDPDLLSILLTQCQPCSDDRLMLAKLAMDSLRFRVHLIRLLNDQNFVQFNEELKSYFLYDLEAVRELKMTLLEWEVSVYTRRRLHQSTCVNEWNELCAFIDETFEHDADVLDDINSIKQNFFIYPAKLIPLTDPQCYFDLRDFDNLEKIGEMLITCSEERVEWKYYMSQNFPEIIRRYSFKFNEELNSKLMQCYNDNLHVYRESVWREIFPTNQTYDESLFENHYNGNFISNT